jgi:hypothetical protein
MNHNCAESFDKQTYKKRYLLRKIEEQESKEEILDANRPNATDRDESTEMSEVQWLAKKIK